MTISLRQRTAPRAGWPHPGRTPTAGSTGDCLEGGCNIPRRGKRTPMRGQHVPVCGKQLLKVKNRGATICKYRDRLRPRRGQLGLRARGGPLPAHRVSGVLLGPTSSRVRPPRRVAGEPRSPRRHRDGGGRTLSRGLSRGPPARSDRRCAGPVLAGSSREPARPTRRVVLPLRGPSRIAAEGDYGARSSSVRAAGSRRESRRRSAKRDAAGLLRPRCPPLTRRPTRPRDPQASSDRRLPHLIPSWGFGRGVP